MDEYAFWQQKLIQFFHDPVAKPFTGTPKAGTQKKVAKQLFDAFQEFNQDRKWRNWYKAADWAAAGADRPMLYIQRKKGDSGLGPVHWPKYPLLSHPLDPGQRVCIPIPNATKARENPLEDGEEEARDVLEEQMDAVTALAQHVPDWTDANKLREGFVVLWRRLRDDLQAEFPGDPLWGAMPADSRVPDVAIWDHLKVVTALAFMKPHHWQKEPADEGAREPWMLRMTLGPVGRFIEQARTSRDLWLSSYLLADLAFAAMSPIIERYGPDCIVYPDLRANPRADCWLFDRYRDALAKDANPSTFAAVLPESFVALVPRGVDGHLAPIEELAEKGRDKVAQRWQAYAERVRAWFAEELKIAVEPTGVFETIWERQQQCPIHATWTALPWLPMGRLKAAESLRRPALPAQTDPAKIDPEDAQRIAARERRLKTWVPVETWSRYEHARDVFAHSHLDLLQSERGFDYALTHHQLSARQALRLQTDPSPAGPDEPGEKCTLCGLREALHAGEVQGDSLGARRRSARKFWSRKALDPDESGAERLCAVCAIKRFLVEADSVEKPVFNTLWAGMGENLADFYQDNKARVPFPSTATVAVQEYLEKILKEPRCAAEIAAVVAACRSAGLSRTSFPNALPCLAALGKHELLYYEAEDVLFPEALAGKLAAMGKKDENTAPLKKRKDLENLKKAVKALRAKAAEVGAGVPGTRIAVIRVDGDRMGKLLLGEAGSIAARWRDVLHPEVLARLEGDEKRPQGNAHLKQAGWPDLLQAKRLMGPSLHAFVSRALAAFAHRIAPYAVEREFSGRLIYAGGDDILAIAPAGEAMALAARLQQLFSAAWVVDMPTDEKPWEWRRPGWRGDKSRQDARGRFLVPLAKSGEIDLAKPWRRAPHVTEGGEGEEMPAGWQGELLPMLGTGASLSAGIAIGHYKTPLSVMLQRSKALLRFAKEKGRGRIGFGHASRAGEKSRFALPWRAGDTPAHETLRLVIEGFRSGKIPARLPYKLRETAPSLGAAFEELGIMAREDSKAKEMGDVEEKLVEGLFRSCLGDADFKSTEVRAALRLWRAGVALFRDDLAAATDGLLFCRAMAGTGGEE